MNGLPPGERKHGSKRKARLDHVPGESNFEAQTKKFKFGVGLTTMSSMASTTASRAAAAEAKHGLRHEVTDTVIAELKAAAAATARLKAEPSALPFVCSCVLYAAHSTQSKFRYIHFRARVRRV